MQIEKEYVLYRRDSVEVRKVVKLSHNEGRSDVITDKTLYISFLGDELFSVVREKGHQCYFLAPINILITILDAYMCGRFSKKSTPLTFKLTGPEFYYADIRTKGTDNLYIAKTLSDEEIYLAQWESQNLRNCLSHALAFILN